MIDFLLSVPGRCTLILNGVNTLLTNYTAVRAAYLDVAISSRAPASTALSTTVWTAARAAALDALAALAANLTTLLQRPTLSPPTTLAFTTGATSAVRAALLQIVGLSNSANVSPTAGNYLATINEVGRGNINFLALSVTADPPSGTVGYRITIDDQVFTGNLTGSAGAKSAIVIGAIGVDDSSGNPMISGVAFENIPFLTLFKVEFTNSVSSGTYSSQAKYRRTG